MTGLMEIRERRTNRVVAMCREAGLSLPTFEEITGAAVVTFRAAIVPAGAGRVPPESREKTREKSREKILGAIKADPRVTTAELSRATGLTAKGIEWNLRKLKEAGLLRRVGPAKGRHWEVVS